MTTRQLPPLPEPARWYVVDNIGMATLCADENDAKALADYFEMVYPLKGPHRVVQLAVAAPIKKEQEA